MDSTIQNKKVTASGDASDAPEADSEPGIVPARPASPSYVGLPQVSTAGTSGDTTTAVKLKDIGVGFKLTSQPTEDDTSLQIATSATLSRSGSQVSLHSNKSSCSMDVDKENRKRIRKEMSKKNMEQGTMEHGSVEQGSLQGVEAEDEDEEGEVAIRRKVKATTLRSRRILRSDDEDGSSCSKGVRISTDTMESTGQVVLLSDYEDANDKMVTHSERKDEKGEEVGLGSLREGQQGTSKEEFGVTLKKKRGRKRKIRRKKIGMDELGVHEIEDSDDGEGYDALSAPEMATTAIEYLEEADEIRIKCKNIKGELSGVMKRRLTNAKDIIRGLAKTITKIPVRKEGGEEEDEACFLRMENKELQARLKEKERNCAQKEKEIQLLRNELKDLSEQMKNLRDEVMDIKRNKGKDNNGKDNSSRGSPINRNNRRIERMLVAIGKGDDTSIADDSEAMDIDYLPEFTTDWSNTEDGQTFKRPYPVKSGPSTSEMSDPRLPEKGPPTKYLKIKKEQLKVMKETLQDIRDTREEIKRRGTIGKDVGLDTNKSGHDHQEMPKPQRTPRMIVPRNVQGVRTDIKVIGNVQLVEPKEGMVEVVRKEDSVTEG